MTQTFRFAALFLLLGAAAPALAGGDAEAGKTMATQVCGACHGPKGDKPIAPMYPILAGQYRDYLVQALKEYRDGGRSNPIMKGQAANLTDQDIEDLAVYFSSQQGPLQVLPH